MSFSPLAPDKSICVIAPAGPAPEGRVERGLARLRQHHGRVELRYAPETRAALPYLAADDVARAEALEAALGDSDCGGVLFVRGGYGCARLLQVLPATAAETLRRRRLPMIGFSDVTALHCWAARLGVPSVHGPVLTQLGDLDDAHCAQLIATLRGAPPPLGDLRREVDGDARGRLLGGNLIVLASLAGTDNALDARDAIVLLEDVGEAPYRLDRAVTQLLDACHLERARAIVLGDFVDCDSDKPTPHRALDALRERLVPLGIPLATNAPIGHGRRNSPVLLGTDYALEGATLRPLAH